MALNLKKVKLSKKLEKTFLLVILCAIVSLYPHTIFGSKPSITEHEQLIEQKVSAWVLEKLTDGQFQDLIVEFEHQDILTEAAKQRKTGRLKFNNPQINAFKSARYRDRKKRLFNVIQNAKLNILRDYKHLPLTFVRIRSKRAIKTLISLPEVKFLHENTIFYPHLTESIPFITEEGK